MISHDLIDDVSSITDPPQPEEKTPVIKCNISQHFFLPNSQTSQLLMVITTIFLITELLRSHNFIFIKLKHLFFHYKNFILMAKLPLVIKKVNLNITTLIFKYNFILVASVTNLIIYQL